MLLGSEALRVNGSGFSLLYGIFHCLGDSGTSGFDGEPFVTASLSFSFYWRFLFKIDFSMSMFLS